MPPIPARPEGLPDFENPPVVEVLMSVQFDELRGYRTVHAGLLWEKLFRSKFPKVVEQPLLSPAFETFGPPVQAGSISLSLSPAAGPPVPRLWFVNDATTELIQIQADRFIHNWRKVAAGGEYPRYEYIKERFEEEFKELTAHLEASGIGKPRPNQCEIAYINHIALDPDEDIHASPHHVFPLIREIKNAAPAHSTSMPRLEDAQFQARFVIEDAARKPLGRLIVSAEPAIDDQMPIFRLTLAARGAPKGVELSDVLEFFDVGRATIVNAFAAMTTPKMHTKWGRKK